MNYNKLSIEDFEKLLIKDFPEMYINIYGNETKTCLSGGLETPIGWNNLVYALSRQIYTYCKRNNIEIPVVAQVNEKFDSLRFYLEDSSVETVDRLITEFEHISYYVCYSCGMVYDRLEHAYECDDCKK